MSTPGNQVVRPSRAAQFTDMEFQPGVYSNSPSRSAKGRWVNSNRVRWQKGFPEKIGGWLPQTLGGSNGGVYIGTCRATCDWSSLDGQYWIAFATECKLYLINNATLYDITPVRKSSNTTNVFSTTSGQTTVNVNDVDHRANQGDHGTIIGSITVGGVTLTGDFTIVSVIDPNNYTIAASSAATSTVTNGGGAVTLQYDISCGLPLNGQLLGYGTSTYGAGTYGTPRATGTGVPAKMRTWSLSNWGQDLVASYNNGELYWWQWKTGPNSRAAIVANAPTDIQRLLVNADSEFTIAVGCQDVDGTADPMNVRWCSEGDLNDWLPVILPVANTAGGQRLNYGSRMVAAVQSRQQNLLWSDTQMFQMQFLGEPDIFGIKELGKCFIVGPNAAIDVNGVCYMMCFDDFYIYDGTLRSIPCDMWETVFGVPGQPGTGFDRSQAEATYCTSFMTKSEVTWFYPSPPVDTGSFVWSVGQTPVASLGGVPLSQLSVSNAPAIVLGLTGVVPATVWSIQFTDDNKVVWTLRSSDVTPIIFGGTTQWIFPIVPALTNGKSYTVTVLSGFSNGLDVIRYVTFNYEQSCWYGGTMPRTCYHDVTPALAGFVEYPYGFNNGTFYQHEIGYDEHEPGSVTNAMYWFLQSWDVGQQTDKPMLINSVIPDFERLRNGCQYSYLTKEHPRDTAYQQVGPFTITPDTTRIDERASGTQVALLIEAASSGGNIVKGQDFRMGVWQSLATPHGRRIAAASRGSPINTANP